MIAAQTTSTNCHHDSMPIISSCGLKMNMKGRIAVRLRIPERGDAGLDRVGARDRRRRERGEADRRRHVGHQPEIEDEHVHRDQRHDQPRLRAELDHHRRHQRRDDDVARGRRHAHAEHEADEGHEQQHRDDVAGRDDLDELGHHEAEPGDRHGADDDARGGRGQGDADHVARALLEAVDQVVDAGAQLARAALPRRGRRRAVAAA